MPDPFVIQIGDIVILCEYFRDAMMFAARDSRGDVLEILKKQQPREGRTNKKQQIGIMRLFIDNRY